MRTGPPILGPAASGATELPRATRSQPEPIRTVQMVSFFKKMVSFFVAFSFFNALIIYLFGLFFLGIPIFSPDFPQIPHNNLFCHPQITHMGL